MQAETTLPLPQVQSRRPGHPPLLEWSSVMKECVEHLDYWLHEDLTNIILHYLVEVPKGRLVLEFSSQDNGDSALVNPYGVAVWNSEVFVTDNGNHRICVHRESDGSFVRSIGSIGSKDGQLCSPRGIGVCDDLLFVAEWENDRVSVFRASDGSFVRSWASHGTGQGHFRGPYGLAVSSELKRVYVADCCNNRIGVFGLDGSLIQRIGSYGNGDGQLQYPRGVAVSVAKRGIGLFFVTEWNNGRISVFSALDGSFVKHIGVTGKGKNRLDRPCGIACGDGWVAVSENDNHRVSVFNIFDGSFIRGWGSRGVDAGEPKHPQLMCTNNGLLYVADRDNHRVVVYE